MAETHWIDEHNLVLNALVTVVMQLSFFCIAFACNFDLLTDIAGSSNFCVLAVLSLILGGHYHTRQVVLTVLVLLARAELGAFLLYRVCKRSKDARFDEIRDSFVKFLGFWILQILWVFVVMLPVLFVNGDEAGGVDLAWQDYTGWTLFVVGFLVEVVADLTKYRFRANSANKGKFCSQGIWRYSRHPNFFGEIVLWWGIFLSAVPVIQDSSDTDLGWSTIASPLLTMVLLIFVSGMPTAEGPNLKRYCSSEEGAAAWNAYRNQTSPLIPLPPSIYKRLAESVKCLLCFELPFLRFQPDSHADGDQKKESFLHDEKDEKGRRSENIAD